MLLHYDFKILSIRETCTRDRYAVLDSTTPYDPSLGATIVKLVSGKYISELDIFKI